MIVVLFGSSRWRRDKGTHTSVRSEEAQRQCVLGLLHDTSLAAALLAPLAALLSQSPDSADTTGPQTLDRCAECEGTLGADHADSLQDGLAAVTAEHGRVVDPLQAGLELVIQGGDGLVVDTRGGSHGAEGESVIGAAAGHGLRAESVDGR